MLSRMWTKMILSLLLLLLIGPGFRAEDFYEEEFQSPEAAVRKFWGIQDVTISVGKLLHCKIPPDAFKGSIVSYDVNGEDGKSLPAWMIFDSEAAILEGVPSENDIGDVRINVKAFDSRGHFVSDMFVIEVYPLLEKNTDNKRKCKRGENVNMIVIIIDKHINDFTPFQKIKVIQNLSAYLDIPITTLLLLSAKFVDEIEVDSMLHKYNALEFRNSNKSVLTWQVGCNEKIWAEKFRTVELVKKYVSDGVLSKTLQLPLIESRLLSSPKPFRLRRDTDANQASKSASKPSIDEDDDDGDDDEVDLKEEEEDDSDDLLDAAPPVTIEFSSSVPHEHIRSSPVSDKPIVPSDSPPHIAGDNKLNGLPLNGNDVPEEESTESPDEDEYEINFSGSKQTPKLPPVVEQSNGSVISVTPLFAENAIENVTTKARYPPTVTENLESIVVEAGSHFNLSIPERTFIDEEDGSTRNLTLKLKSPAENSSCPSWIEFNAEKQELLLLPWLDLISNYDFVIEASDTDNMTAVTNFTVAVQYPKTTQSVNFEISLHFKPVNDQNLNVSFLLNVLDHIATLYGDANASNIVVRNISCNPFVLTWTNRSLPMDACDNSSILNLLNVLTDKEWNTSLNSKVRQEMSSSVEVEKVSWNGIGLCQNLFASGLLNSSKNFEPVVGKRIDNVTARVGELLVFKIPEDAFYARNIPSSDLKINVLTINHTPISSDNWLQYDATNRELYGLPMAKDAGSTKYQLVCLNEENYEQSARQVVDFVVKSADEVPYNIEFSITLKMSFEAFSKSPAVRRSFVEKLASVFGDRDSSSIVISSYIPGSVIVTWYNKSLPIDKCQETEIKLLRKVLLDDDGKLNGNVNHVLGADFEAQNGQMTPLGICEGGSTELHSTEINPPSQEFHPVLLSDTFSYVRENFREIILPILIIVTMLLLAAMVACFLYRRQRTAKWTVGDDDRRTYRNKGIPVIFQDELEERLEPTNKSPIIMKEEKPPLPPPEYQKTLPMATTALLSDFDDPSYQQGTVTFTSRADRNGRSKATPIYRKPPPYVPP